MCACVSVSMMKRARVHLKLLSIHLIVLISVSLLITGCSTLHKVNCVEMCRAEAANKRRVVKNSESFSVASSKKNEAVWSGELSE